MAQELSGVVDSITYYSEDTGYSVIKIVPDNPRTPTPVYDGTVTVVGTMAEFGEGESVQFTGTWEQHRQYGKQFKVIKAILRLPRTEPEMISYLSGEAVRGIGAESAAAIVRHFGEATFEILDEEPERLYRIPELKPEVARRLIHQWEHNHVQRHTLNYLQTDLGFSAKLARRIYTAYGPKTRRTIRTNPYQLAADDFRTFKQADEIAKSLGVLADHRVRLRAGMLQALHDFANEGHTFAPRAAAIAGAGKLLDSQDEGALEAALNAQLDAELLGEDSLDDGGAKPIRAIYLPKYYQAENAIVDKLRVMADKGSRLMYKQYADDWRKALASLPRSDSISLSDQQTDAIVAALTEKVCVMTGGPGTGKTTILRELVKVASRRSYAVTLAAPTGRAARRLSDATGHIASTIHRLLVWEPETNWFSHNEGNPLATDMVIVDEASMLDLLLLDSLIRALQPTAHLLLVGDVDQLPSVGAGNVLRDVIDSGVAKVTRLDKVYRQEEKSHIVSNAHSINRGQMPYIGNDSRDFFFFNIKDPGELASWVVDIVARRVPQEWQYDPKHDIQVIAPLKAGAVGVKFLNRRLQQALNGAAPAEAKFRSRVLRVGDKVMQTQNDYEKEVFNGDIGFIDSIDTAAKSLKVRFEYGNPEGFSKRTAEDSDDLDLEQFLERPKDLDLVHYSFSETDALELAYCITVHKSQGSEFPVVVMPVHSGHGRMLQRNLLYTAITRAEKMVILVGTANAIQRAVKNNNVAQRHSGLLHRLRG